MDAESEEASLSKPVAKAEGVAGGGRGRRRLVGLAKAERESGFDGGSVMDGGAGAVKENGWDAGFENWVGGCSACSAAVDAGVALAKRERRRRRGGAAAPWGFMLKPALG